MKALPTWMVILVGAAAIAGCERELPYMASVDQTISGYRIEGYVTDRLGLPVKGLRIGLRYDLDYIDSDNPPARQFFVDDTTKVARVVVLDRQNKVRRVLFEGSAKMGVLDYEFDLRDSAGVLLPTGIYTISFSMDGVTKGSFNRVINGSVTAVKSNDGVCKLMEAQRRYPEDDNEDERHDCHLRPASSRPAAEALEQGMGRL